MLKIDDLHMCQFVVVGTKRNEIGVVIGSTVGLGGYVVNIDNQVKSTDYTPVSIPLKYCPSVEGKPATPPVRNVQTTPVLRMPVSQANAPAKYHLPPLYLRGVAIELLTALWTGKSQFVSSSGECYQSLPFSRTPIGSTCDTSFFSSPSDMESLIADRTALLYGATLIVPIEFPAVLVEIDELTLLARESRLWDGLSATTRTQYLRIRHIVTLLGFHLRQLYQSICLVSNDRDNPSISSPRTDHHSGASPSFQLACCRT